MKRNFKTVVSHVAAKAAHLESGVLVFRTRERKKANLSTLLGPFCPSSALSYENYERSQSAASDKTYLCRLKTWNSV